jgi:MoaA/NifB/PqqE/SkfB family radical SAM enzyme
MELAKAKEIIQDMASAGVTGISFTAGEPFLYFDDLLELVDLCRQHSIYTRIVTNSFWAATADLSRQRLELLKQSGLCQLRLSYSRWHQEHVPRANILHAAQGCLHAGIGYFVSFVTDFSAEDDEYEHFLREHGLRFFPEPVIYAGRADTFGRSSLQTDYQDNRCAMNPYLAPDLNLYACCDAGSHFRTTNFFLLGNLTTHTIDELLIKSERDPLYNCIRSMGITPLASFAGFKAREIITHRKCELCKKLFDEPETLKILQDAAGGPLQRWVR